MNPEERMRMLDDKKPRLSDKNDEYKELVERQANARREYNVEYARQLLKLKSEGTPITIAKELCRGNKAVADLEFDLEVATAIVRASLESMKDIREAIGADRSILTWLREEKQSG